MKEEYSSTEINDNYGRTSKLGGPENPPRKDCYKKENSLEEKIEQLMKEAEIFKNWGRNLSKSYEGRRKGKWRTEEGKVWRWEAGMFRPYLCYTQSRYTSHHFLADTSDCKCAIYCCRDGQYFCPAAKMVKEVSEVSVAHVPSLLLGPFPCCPSLLLGPSPAALHLLPFTVSASAFFLSPPAVCLHTFSRLLNFTVKFVSMNFRGWTFSVPARWMFHSKIFCSPK